MVNVYALVNGTWELLFEDITEEQANAIWLAAFQTGENKISIESERSRRIREMNARA